MPVVKLTKSNIDKMPFNDAGQTIYHDPETRGFLLCVGKSTKTYYAQHTINGRYVRVKIGHHGVFTPEQARQAARDKIFEMAKGADPRTVKAERDRRNVKTKDLLQEYCAARRRMTERTKEDYKKALDSYTPDWMERPLVSITKHDVLERHTEIGTNHGPYVANKTMRIIRALFNFVYATYDIAAENPVRYLSRVKAWYPEKRRRTCVKAHQLPIWFKAVNALENDIYRDFFLLTLFTGLRRNEAAGLRWENVDFGEKSFSIPDTKNHEPLTLPMSDFIHALFLRRKEAAGEKDEWVFPGPGEKGHFVEPKKGILWIVKETDVKFSTHDLRRTFITIAESLDISAYALKSLLNHKLSGDVTAGYIVIDVERLRQPMQRITDYILEKTRGE